MTVPVTRKERKEEDGGIKKETKKMVAPSHRKMAEKEERSKKISRFSFDHKKKPVLCRYERKKMIVDHELKAEKEVGRMKPARRKTE
ncbi:hypothetical protein L1987_06375 [Smallanthus sonchifolius]|uniref:Uncharacterized protein n=1 Tax=Smallanthus sonchifolius TaxID=185202 RepID=A0ACB9JY21_9ASTR|nr:hypothetical protein L1987_06375 [Smallanthus sonchifolius]